MSQTAAARDAWVARVLGVEVQPAPRVETKAFADAARAWREASEAVDGQITELQALLRRSGDPELAAIAEYGLNAITGGFKVKLLAALRDVAAAGTQATPQQIARARQAAASFRAHLDREPRVQACDDNPFGIRMSIRGTLGPALGRLDAALRPA